MKIGFRPVQGGETFQKTLKQVQLAEEQGFDSTWLTEHHGWDVSWPSPHLALAGLATKTETITLGTSVLLLPLYNPVRLAGEAALLDQISDGRVTLGVALGYQEREFDALNVPVEGRVTRFVDNIKVLRALFEEETVDYEGKTYELADFSLSPHPVQNGGPPLWCGGEADAALKRAALFGDEWLPSWSSQLETVKGGKERYVEYLEQYNRAPETKEFPIIRAVSIAEDHDEAVERARTSFQPIIEEYLKNGYEMGVDPEAFDDIMDIATDRFMIGTPEAVTEQLTSFVDAYGTDHLILKLWGPGVTHDEILETLELLGDQVFPHLPEKV